MSGLSTRQSISFGMALVAGRKRVPSPAAGKTALRIFWGVICPARTFFWRFWRAGSIVAGWCERIATGLPVRMRDGSDGFYALKDHTVPDVGGAAGAGEFDIGEAGFHEGLGQRFARPEFDVAVIPEDGKVAVHFTGKSEEKILEIAVIGGCENDDSAWLQEIVTVAQKTAGVVDVFDDLRREDDVNRADGIEELGVKSLAVGEEEVDVGKSLASDLDSGGREIGAVKLPVSILKEREERAIAAAGVHDDRARRNVLEKTRD